MDVWLVFALPWSLINIELFATCFFLTHIRPVTQRAGMNTIPYWLDVVTDWNSLYTEVNILQNVAILYNVCCQLSTWNTLHPRDSITIAIVMPASCYRRQCQYLNLPNLLFTESSLRVSSPVSHMRAVIYVGCQYMCRYVEVFPACVALTWMSINVSICGNIACMCGNYLG